MWLQDDSKQTTNNGISDRILRVGLVGAGYIAPFHIRFLRKVPAVDIVGIADIVPARADRLAQAYGIAAACRSIDELLDVGLDVLHVLTPAPSHAELALAGLQAGCHVLVEKPFTCSVDDCNRLQEGAERQNRRILVDHSLLGDPAVRKGLLMVRRKGIGTVSSLSFFRAGTAPERDFREPYPLPGDPFREVGTHALYCVTAFLGDIQDADVRLSSTGKHPSFQYDEWNVQLECECGVAQIHLTWTLPLQQTIDLHGDQGRLQMDLGPSIVLKQRHWSTDRRIALAAAPVARSLSTIGQVSRTILRYCTGRYGTYKGIETMIGEFYKALRAGGPMPIDFHRARHIVEWTERIAAQAELDSKNLENRPVGSNAVEVPVS